MTSRDPSKAPELPDGVLRAAEALGKKMIHVMCDPPDAKVGDPGGIAFFAIVDFVPRVGEYISTQDKKRCRVKDVYHQVTTVGDPDRPTAFTLIPNVFAISVEPED